MSEMLKTKVHNVDVCVVGGGIGGMFTAISAARQGAKVALMQDRPVLGGNCSSEIRMWISGAGTRVRDLQETGIMEELLHKLQILCVAQVFRPAIAAVKNDHHHHGQQQKQGFCVFFQNPHGYAFFFSPRRPKNRTKA